MTIDWTHVLEPRYRLRLERESVKYWIVCHHDTVFFRVADRLTAERFMFAFADKHGAGSIDLDSIELERERAASRAVARHHALAPVVRLSDRRIVA